ncbi:MAG TPA: alpha-L-arabinofuranosidase C-terminal domain-containing protein [Terracidiphilus sp.]|nr:alpha-L-arabinofuranosidase C-terminal domain-containing protein [Terracidiphilus sp.]
MTARKRFLNLLLLVLAPAALAAQASSNPVVIRVDAAHPGAAIAPNMFGIFFEDINFAADGGLYPELVKNRSFEFTDPLTGWHEVMDVTARGIATPKGELDVRTDDPESKVNPHYLRARANTPGYGFYNGGFRGMGIEAGKEYRLSAYVRTGGLKELRAELQDEKGKVLGSGKLEGFGDGWKRYETVIRASATEPKARLVFYLDEKGSVDLDFVSLFPVDTWKGRPNGLRKDLVQLLYDLHPGVLRFPGGCIVEGRELANRYRWKSTVGDIAERKTILNRWNLEFESRPTPDYFQSFGLGFYEYFQLAEDIGAKPLPILNCGMACQFNSSETARLEDLKEYIQDAEDLIEFANGDVSTPWGKLRAEMGHPAPFGLDRMGIGNEQWGPRYVERYKAFAEALRAKHPEIKLVAAAGPSPDGELFDDLWAQWRQLKPDFVDEHYYMSPEWFLENTHRYDNYDRSGPKVFAGEYAAQTKGTTRPDNANNWKGALAEAAFMSGLERNGDVVQMSSYAPLMAHVDAWQWKPDEIWFDNLRSFGTPNYYVQLLYANNTGTRLVPATSRLEDGLYTSAVLDERTHEWIVKAINTTAKVRKVEIRIDGAKAGATAKVITLRSATLEAENSFEHPQAVAPVTGTAVVKDGVIATELGAYSVNVYRVSEQ